MKGYQIRNRPTMVEQINARPRRRTFDQWVADLTALSGKRDVSAEDAAVQEAFAADPRYNVQAMDHERRESSESYAAAEVAEGRWREDHPNDPTET